MKNFNLAVHTYGVTFIHHFWNECDGSGDDDGIQYAHDLAEEAIAEFGLTEDELEEAKDIGHSLAYDIYYDPMCAKVLEEMNQ